jgi:hypothetical protein
LVAFAAPASYTQFAKPKTPSNTARRFVMGQHFGRIGLLVNDRVLM